MPSPEPQTCALQPSPYSEQRPKRTGAPIRLVPDDAAIGFLCVAEDVRVVDDPLREIPSFSVLDVLDEKTLPSKTVLFRSPHMSTDPVAAKYTPGSTTQKLDIGKNTFAGLAPGVSCRFLRAGDGLGAFGRLLAVDHSALG